MCTWPPTISLRAPVLLLYATWRMSVPVIKRKSSPAICLDDPGPEEAKVKPPGLDLASAITCPTFFAGTDGCTTMTESEVEADATATKSRINWYGLLRMDRGQSMLFCKRG